MEQKIKQGSVFLQSMYQSYSDDMIKRSELDS